MYRTVLHYADGVETVGSHFQMLTRAHRCARAVAQEFEREGDRVTIEEMLAGRWRYLDHYEYEAA